MTDLQTAIATSIVVDAPVERAFAVFTEDMGSWWPEEHHILQAPLARMVFEPAAGGEIYDVGTDGSECRWARVLAYEPPHRIVFSWNISMQWQIETDPAKASEVEIRFTAEGPRTTLVELTHSKFERHGEGYQQLRAIFDGPGAWGDILALYAKAAHGDRS